MGMFDTVIAKCPNCKEDMDFQSKGGECLGRDFTLESVPNNVLSNVNRHSPQKCYCGKWIYIDEKAKEVKIWEKDFPAIKELGWARINWFYNHRRNNG